MLNSTSSYHGTIKKTIIAFGSLFSNITVDRRQGDTIDGDIIQSIKVPITYAPKEKWIVRLEQDPNLSGYTYTSLPRMSFEIESYSYDATRKVGKMQQIACKRPGGASNAVFSPVPYIIDISLYILTKNQEDGLQIIEQILPIFGPEYVLSINAIPEMDLVQNIPITLRSVNVDDQYDGSFEIRRFVTHTLRFDAKINLYGPVTNPKLIYHTDTTIVNSDSNQVMIQHVANGDPNTGTITEFLLDGF